mgnify:CR=1 FL=1|jgi:hypothetical protein
MARWMVIALTLAALVAPGNAMLYYNLGNAANTTDPGTGVPFDSVGKITTADGSGISGSAIYLGGGYVLTAHHVTTNATFSHVTFGSTVYQVDMTAFSGSMSIQVEPGVDMKILKLTTAPDIAPVNLLSAPIENFSEAATLVGWGNGRDPSAALGETVVPWGNTTTSAHRWGLNVPRFTETLSYDSYSCVDLIITILGGPAPTYDPPGVGDAEAALAVYDSGGGLFQEINGTWYLVGLAVATDINGVSTFGDDQPFVESQGDFNYFVRISSYYDSILAIIPEPSTATLLGMTLFSAALVFGRGRRNAR